MSKAINIQGLDLSVELVDVLKGWIVPSSPVDSSIIERNIRAIEKAESYLIELWTQKYLDDARARFLVSGVHWACEKLKEINRLSLDLNVGQEGGAV